MMNTRLGDFTLVQITGTHLSSDGARALLVMHFDRGVSVQNAGSCLLNTAYLDKGGSRGQSRNHFKVKSDTSTDHCLENRSKLVL